METTPPESYLLISLIMTRISKEEYLAIIGAPPKKTKYNNNKPEYYDKDLKEKLKFDSNKELEYYLLLKDRLKRGEITNLKRQVEIEIQEAFTMPTGEKIQAITYIADFTYSDVKDGNYYGDFHIVDVKGLKTDVYKLKKKLLAYKGIYIEEV